MDECENDWRGLLTNERDKYSGLIFFQVDAFYENPLIV